MNSLLQLFQISLISCNHYCSPGRCRLSSKSFKNSSSSPQTCGNPCKDLKDGYGLLQISGPVPHTTGETARDARLQIFHCHLAPLHLSCSRIYSMWTKRSRFIMGSSGVSSRILRTQLRNPAVSLLAYKEPRSMLGMRRVLELGQSFRLILRK